jgi:uncharacterized protein DUF3617
MKRLLALALLCPLAASLPATLSAAPITPTELPKLKAGLWEVRTTFQRREGQPPQLTSMCLDESVQRDMYQMSMGMMAGMCSKHDIDLTGSKVTAVADCNLGVSKMRSRSVMTLTGNTAYRTEAHATFDPPLNGQAESTTLIEGRHVGACKPGQRPGDVTLPNGTTINMRQMMAPPKS